MGIFKGSLDLFFLILEALITFWRKRRDQCHTHNILAKEKKSVLTQRMNKLGNNVLPCSFLLKTTSIIPMACFHFMWWEEGLTGYLSSSWNKIKARIFPNLPTVAPVTIPSPFLILPSPSSSLPSSLFPLYQRFSTHGS